MNRICSLNSGYQGGVAGMGNDSFLFDVDELNETANIGQVDVVASTERLLFTAFANAASAA